MNSIVIHPKVVTIRQNCCFEFMERVQSNFTQNRFSIAVIFRRVQIQGNYPVYRKFTNPCLRRRPIYRAKYIGFFQS